MGPVSFRHYLIRRGYDLDAGPMLFFRRMFLDVWAAPGFHRFWRIWNPFFGYLLFHLYRALGGSRRPLLSTMVVFGSCGLMLHDLPVFVVSAQPQIGSTAAFLAFGFACLASRAAEPRLGFSAWPWAARVGLNAVLVVAGLLFGSHAQGWIVGGRP